MSADFSPFRLWYQAPEGGYGFNGHITPKDMFAGEARIPQHNVIFPLQCILPPGSQAVLVPLFIQSQPIKRNDPWRYRVQVEINAQREVKSLSESRPEDTEAIRTADALLSFVRRAIALHLEAFETIISLD